MYHKGKVTINSVWLHDIIRENFYVVIYLQPLGYLKLKCKVLKLMKHFESIGISPILPFPGAVSNRCVE